MCSVPGGKNDRHARNRTERRPQRWYFVQGGVFLPPKQKIHPSHREVRRGECIDCGASEGALKWHCTNVHIP